MQFSLKRSGYMLNREKTALVIIDIQEKILRVMQNEADVVDNALKLIQGFKVLNIPLFYTEQYPKGLGPTDSRLLGELEGLSSIQKMSFSCSGAPNFFMRLKDNNVEQVVVCGIEAHVCVQQTVLDLLANEFQVFVPADAVSSRKLLDYNTALKRMRHHGAEVTTTEAVLFELLDVCGTDEFKQISKIVK